MAIITAFLDVEKLKSRSEVITKILDFLPERFALTKLCASAVHYIKGFFPDLVSYFAVSFSLCTFMQLICQTSVTNFA